MNNLQEFHKVQPLVRILEEDKLCKFSHQIFIEVSQVNKKAMKKQKIQNKIQTWIPALLTYQQQKRDKLLIPNKLIIIQMVSLIFLLFQVKINRLKAIVKRTKTVRISVKNFKHQMLKTKG